MNNKEKPTRKEMAALTREKILESAYTLYQEQNPDDINIEMITQKAGIAKGSFYVHFKSKNALISEMSRQRVLQVDLEYETFFNEIPSGTSSHDSLLLLVNKIMDVLTETLGYERLRIMYMTLLDKNEDINAVVSLSRKLYGLLFKLISTGIESNEFRSDLSADMVARQLLISLRGLTYQWCVLYPDFNIYKNTEEHIKLMLNGMMK